MIIIIMMKTVGIIVCLAVAGYAYPQAKVEVGMKSTNGQHPVSNIQASHNWMSTDKNTQGSISGSQTIKHGEVNGDQTKVSADASHQLKFNNDRGKLGGNINLQSEQLGQVNEHQAKAEVSGSYDVFKSDGDQTKGTIFAGANEQWNSHSPKTGGYEYGGTFEHSLNEKGKVGVDIKDANDQAPNLKLHGSQTWMSEDKNTQVSISGSHNRKFDRENEDETLISVGIMHLIKTYFDRINLIIEAKHERELFGPVDKHETNIGVKGSYDVYKSDDGKVKGSVYVDANQQFNSHSPDNKEVAIGGKIEFP